MKGYAVLVSFFTQNISNEKTVYVSCTFFLILTSHCLHNVRTIILIWIECGHSTSFCVLFYFFCISFVGKYIENRAPAHKMCSLNGLKVSSVETPLIVPFHSILNLVKNSKKRFVQKGLSASTTMEIVWTETTAMCFCLTLACPLFTQRRERHTESSCSGIFGPCSL